MVRTSEKRGGIKLKTSLYIKYHYHDANSVIVDVLNRKISIVNANQIAENNTDKS
jgi:hypothetical protein